jgi:4-hydroxy-tetrahydrodipicolinate reductase
MGIRILSLLPGFPDLRLVAALVRPGHPHLGQDAGVAGGLPPLGVPLTSDIGDADPDVLIDYSTADAVRARLPGWERRGMRLLIGTTALSKDTLARLARLARRRGVLVAPNTSRGVTALLVLAGTAGRLLPDWAAGFEETHHRAKKDIPSGTALALARALGRKGIPIRSIRQGDVVGEHTLVLTGPGERLELRHSARSRDAFARGALEAARFLARARAGTYAMADVLGLSR